jgi:hypothetical protein
MVEKQTKTITIDDKEYNEDDLTTQQKMLISHVSDLDRKIASTAFNLDQLKVGRDTFMKMLKDALENEKGEDALPEN